MWNTRESKINAETIIKESLLRQLSHAVKEVQLYFSQTKEVCTTQEGTSSLVGVLEAIFLHALKRSLLESAIRSVSATEDVKPTPNFFNAVRTITHKDTIAHIIKLSLVKTEVGRSRAWIRMALNEAAVPSYFAAVAADRRLAGFYRPTAFLRDKETLETASRLLDGLLPVSFNIPLNSSLLDTWSSEPLLMSGLWSPALRETVQVAVDVAGGIEDDETCSEMTASSSVRSLMTLDESQALQLILDTHSPIEEQEILEELKEEIVETNKEEEEQRERMQRSYSYLLESCTPNRNSDISVEDEANWIKDAAVTSTPEYQLTLEIDDDISQPVPVRRQVEEDFSTLLNNTSNGQNEIKIQTDVKAVNNEETRQRNRNLDDLIYTIPREIGLKAQRFECADCQLSIGLNFGTALYCNVTGEYLCESCHSYELGIVPSRVVYNWDYTKYPIGKRASEYLISKLSEPLFNIDKLNPKLYNVVKDLQEVLLLRRRLKLLHVYLMTCKNPVQLTVRNYLLESSHLFSMSDLLSVSNGGLKTELNKLINEARGHVIDCWVCRQKGFICEVCRDPQVIYPFDAEFVYRCCKCKAVYHGGCLTNRSCPKCQRRKQRQQNEEETV